ncbi:unnamed protein product [Linum tenue]|uniref:RING-type domain-containing protein n=1 Tax=Linum tenue TaxID=586396 RepID=A0AAV0NC01_9ROSI|nr:unnamed protein product [Linum tenue]
MNSGKVVGSIRMVLAYLKWGWDLLFHLSFFHHRHHNYSYSYYPHENYESNDVVSATAEDLRQSSECAVCLSKVEQGDEIRELPCRHLFHKVCLDRWCQSRRQATCPLCRRSLTSTPATSRGSSGGAAPEVLLFDFARFVSSDHDTRDTWWLR